MKPYYEESGIQIFHGDCREILPLLPDKSVDLVLTDPPYGISLNTDNSRFSGGTAGNIAKRGNGIGSAGGHPVIGDDEPFDPRFLLTIGAAHIIWGWNNCEIAVKRLAQSVLDFDRPKEELKQLALLRESGHPDKDGIEMAMGDWIYEDAMNEVDRLKDEAKEPP